RRCGLCASRAIPARSDLALRSGVSDGVVARDWESGRPVNRRREPVRFADATRTLLADGARVRPGAESPRPRVIGDEGFDACGPPGPDGGTQPRAARRAAPTARLAMAQRCTSEGPS